MRTRRGHGWPKAAQPLYLIQGQYYVMDMRFLSPHTRAEAFSTARLKEYPDGSWELMACDMPTFTDGGWEEHGDEHAANVSNKRDTSGAERSPREAEQREPSREDMERSMRRAAAKVRDIALCNDFRWFVTLTLDPAKIDRHDMDALVCVLNRWADNRVRRHGLRYVLVPERHKDGAIHLHGFFNDALSMVDSGTVRRPGIKQPRKPRSASERQRWLDEGGQIVYNVPDWTLGFSTALPLYGDYHAAVGYVCKYVRKQQEKIGGRWYYSGGKLEKPKVSYPDVTIEELRETGAGYTFCVPGRAFCIVRGGGENGAVHKAENGSDSGIPSERAGCSGARDVCQGIDGQHESAE